MNRRGFFGRLAGAVAAGIAATSRPVKTPGELVIQVNGQEIEKAVAKAIDPYLFNPMRIPPRYAHLRVGSHPIQIGDFIAFDYQGRAINVPLERALGIAVENAAADTAVTVQLYS